MCARVRARGFIGSRMGTLDDHLEDLLLVVVGERCAPAEEFEDKASQRPVVRALVVALVYVCARACVCVRVGACVYVRACV